MDYGKVALGIATKQEAKFSKARETYTISRSKYYSGTSNGTDIDTTYRSAHEVLADCHSIRVCFGNYYQDERTTGGLTPYTLNVSLDYNGVLYPLFFENGSNAITVGLGATVWTKPIGVQMKKGERFFIRSHVVTTTGGKYPTGLTLIDNVNQEGLMAGDLTAGTWVRATQTIFAFSPLVITGVPSLLSSNFKAVGFCGDSISQGAGATITSIDGNLMGEFGMLQNGAKKAGWGYVSMGTNGQKASEFVSLNTRINRMNFFRSCDLVIVEYGTNDLSSGQTLEQLKTNLKLIHQLFWDMGIPTVQTTIVPRTTSTDAWASTANQMPVHANTAGGSGSVRSQLNDWIRSNTDGIKCLEIADLVESSRNSGLWGVTPQVTTADGIHPNNYGHHTLCARAIETYLRSL